MVPHSDSGMVAAWKNTGTAVAYFDDGTVFSSKIGSEIEVNMTLTDVSGLDPVNPGKIIIDYTDLADPLTDIPPVERNFTITGNVMTCVSAISTTSNGIRLNSVLVTTRSAGGSEVTVLSKNPALEAAQSESFYIHANCNLADINKDASAEQDLADVYFVECPYISGSFTYKGTYNTGKFVFSQTGGNGRSNGSSNENETVRVTRIFEFLRGH
ncbi:MAG TPA: hypothetical protein VHO70_20015 [Chitinispirillaceae bacterium]|nr:hypothetical protein [Chitinispirillaceae bacterium]